MVEAALASVRSPLVGMRACVGPAVRHGVWFGVFLLLAPAIGPRGFGEFVLALSGIAIAEALLTEPLIAALAALTDVQARHISTALLTAVALGGGVAATLHAAAVPLSAMVDEAAFGECFQSLTVLPLIGALTVVPIALLRRADRRGPFAVASTLGAAAGGGIGVALAWAGTGPWALVAQSIAQRLVECAVLWIGVGTCAELGWSRGHFVDLVHAVRPHALAAAAPVAARHLPCLVIGLSLGPIATGLYMLASRLAEAAFDAVIAGPPSSRGLTALAVAWRACRALLAALLCGALLPIVVPWLFDPPWWGAVPPAQILLLAAAPTVFIGARMAGAKDAAAANWRATQALAGVAAAAIAAPHGLVAVAAATLLTAMALAAARLASTWRRIGIVTLTPGLLRRR